VTTAPVGSFWRSIVLDGGAERFEIVKVEQDFTADESEAYAVTVHAPPLPPLPVVVVDVVFVVSELDEVFDVYD
jgi:hypothetical protein